MTPIISHSVDKLIDELTKLPSIGRKTAQRIALFLLKQPLEECKALSMAILDAKAKTRQCTRCYNYCEGELCRVCEDETRDRSRICVLEQASDVASFERGGFYKGLYHILGGAISPLEGITQEDLRIQELLARINPEVVEVIIATNSSSAGETTALYLRKLILPYKIKISRIARGIPMGSELEFADEATLYRAFEDRVEA